MKVKVTVVAVSTRDYLRRMVQEAFPGAEFNETGRHLSAAELAEFLAGADAAIFGLDRIDEPLLAALPRLKVLAKFGVGLDNVDLAAAERLGKAVHWQPGTNRLAVAEQTVGLMIGLVRNLFLTSRLLAQGKWHKDGGRQLAGKTVGIVGCGHIGLEVVRLLQPFACRVLVNDILDRRAAIAPFAAEQAEFDTLVSGSDLLSLHVPLTDRTRHLVDAQVLRRMPPRAFLVNTSRGQVVDQAALKQALAEHWIAGAALDVFAAEPPDDREFLALPNLVATPHIAGNAREATELMLQAAIAGIRQSARAAAP